VCAVELSVNVQNLSRRPTNFDQRIIETGKPISMSKLRVELKKFNPYICSNQELSLKRFSLAFKREIVPNLKAKILVDSKIYSVENEV